MRQPRPPRPRLLRQPLVLGLAFLLALLAALASASSSIEGIFGGVQFTKGAVNVIERAAELAKDKANAQVAPLHLAACMFDEDTVRALTAWCRSMHVAEGPASSAQSTSYD